MPKLGWSLRNERTDPGQQVWSHPGEDTLATVYVFLPGGTLELDLALCPPADSNLACDPPY